MKYIDAEKLIALLEQRKKQLAKWTDKEYANQRIDEIDCILDVDIDSFQQETSEISLEEFTEKMKDWKARYNYPDNIPIKATMAFTARMFYMYPDVAREWYDGLPKVTQD
jgi:hypothetical protein